MKRKLVKQGAATLMVSLPSKWIKKYNLNKGDEIEVETMSQGILLSPEKVNIKSEVKIQLKDSIESSTRTLITSAYRGGYDRILISFNNEKQFKILENVIQTRLIGFDIVKKGENACIVENITELSPNQFGNILNKVFMNISALFKITKDRMENKRPEENYEDVENRIMQYDNFCRRVIAKRKVDEEKSELFWSFLHLVDHGQREIYYLNKLLGSVKISKLTKELLQDAEKMFELMKQVYETKKMELLSEGHSLNKEIFSKKGYVAIQTTRGKEAVILYHIMGSIRRFFQANSPLTGLLL
ncbi:MAG: AbrB/MazE/SpoVT family DNA-binding domain-containing protein [Nanoarchaeota archaeon]|nr:AbrB/MazE/SpoVT family DNA-binding domain-containing protein [Nanoarchaeota archaeon]